MWNPQMAALTARFRVLRYDTRGHGATDVPAGPYTLEGPADGAVGRLTALGIPKTPRVGLSMGGTIGPTPGPQAPGGLASPPPFAPSRRGATHGPPAWGG